MAKSHRPTSETILTLSKIRTDLYGLLSFAYIQLPEKKILKLKWEPAAQLLRYPQRKTEDSLKQIQTGLGLITSYGSKTNLPDEEILKNLSRDWTRLFRGVVRDGILPPYESLYRPEKLRKEPAQQINRLFSAMGIQVPEEWHQPSDFIGVELDFMRFLCEKEMQLRDRGEPNALLQEVVEAESSFLERHLALWVPIFCEKMFQQAAEDYYRGIARLTTGLVAYDGIYVRTLLSD